MSAVKEACHERICIEEDYAVVNGRITRPGKFEGERVYVPFFWEHALDGCATEYRDGSIGVAVERMDRFQFPELGRKRVVKMVEDAQGFVREL